MLEGLSVLARCLTRCSAARGMPAVSFTTCCVVDSWCHLSCFCTLGQWISVAEAVSWIACPLQAFLKSLVQGVLRLHGSLVLTPSISDASRASLPGGRDWQSKAPGSNHRIRSYSRHLFMQNYTLQHGPCPASHHA